MIARFAVLQIIGCALIVAAWASGMFADAFSGANAIVLYAVAFVLMLGLGAAVAGRWDDAAWLAKHVVRLGLLGTVAGLIQAFAEAKAGIGTAGDVTAVKAMIGDVVDGMHIALYATLTGIAANLWLKITMKVMAGRDG